MYSDDIDAHGMLVFRKQEKKEDYPMCVNTDQTYVSILLSANFYIDSVVEV